VETGVPVFLLSAPSAAASVGPAWFTALAALATADKPDAPIDPVLDCGSMPGYALAALRHGLKTIRYDGGSFDAVAEIAAQCGATVLRDRPPSLDLGDLAAGCDDEAAFADACRRWLLARE
jgi:hypothetical protein